MAPLFFCFCDSSNISIGLLQNSTTKGLLRANIFIHMRVSPPRCNFMRVHVCPLHPVIYANFLCVIKKLSICPDTSPHSRILISLCEGTFAAVWLLHEAGDVLAHGATFDGCFLFLREWKREKLLSASMVEDLLPPKKQSSRVNCSDFSIATGLNAFSTNYM